MLIKAFHVAGGEGDVTSLRQNGLQCRGPQCKDEVLTP